MGASRPIAGDGTRIHRRRVLPDSRLTLAAANVRATAGWRLGGVLATSTTGVYTSGWHSRRRSPSLYLRARWRSANEQCDADLVQMGNLSLPPCHR